MKHLADGLYWFSYERAKELFACNGHLVEWRRLYGEALVPITYEVILTQEKFGNDHMEGSAVRWLADHMLEHERITIKEFELFGIRLQNEAPWYKWENTSHAAKRANIFMYLLYKRAVREGLIK